LLFAVSLLNMQH